MKTIIFTGGGTCGHITPNLALIEKLKKEYKCIYIGSNEMEKTLTEKAGVTYYEVRAPKFNRKLSLSTLGIPCKLLSSIKKCGQLLKQLKPDLIFSKGGYVSLPVVIAGHKLKIPIISHESDFSMGLANKIIYYYCDYMCTSFDNFGKRKKCIFTGTPLREMHTTKAQNLFDCSEKRLSLLFMGGSLGAKTINDFVKNNFDKLTSKYNIIHITGRNNKTDLKSKNYYQIEFAHDIASLYNVADIVVCRSGSNTIFELLNLKKKMILIPLPKGNSRGDQVDNANYFSKHGYAEVIADNMLCLETLEKAVNKLKRQNFSKQATDFPNGTKEIVKLIKSII